MLLQSPWIPRLANIEASPAERLALALADDIVEGRLAGGDRLPAHRDLAKRLRIGLGSVTQAYVSLERRGLTRSVQGRGTFVASRQASGDAVIDLSSNAPPAALDARVLARTLAGIARSIDADHFNLYAPPGGHLEHRRALARWLETVGLPVEASHLVLTSGARQALSLAIELACGPRGVLLTERLTYPGALALARRQGCRVRGVEIDGEGMVPQSLAAALEATPATAGRAVYLTPTLHNPTTATMGAARRRAIVDLCRRAGAWIIEDGVYSVAAPHLPPLAALAPDLCLHVNGMSKALGPGLQIGALALPAALRDAARERLRDLPAGPSALACAVVQEWQASGMIAALQRDLLHEARRRAGLAASILGAHALTLSADAYHAWLPMASAAARRFVAAAADRGVRLTPPESMMVDAADRRAGVRLCLGGPAFADLETALTRLAGLPGRAG